MAKTELNIVINGNSVSAQKALKLVNKQLKDTAGKAGGASASLKKFKLGWIAAAAAIAIAVRSIKGFVDAAAKQEDADNRLAASLKAVGEFTEDNFNKMSTFADEMQRVTIVGDEEVQMLQSKALALGVTSSKMDEAIKGSIGLSAALGIDVNSALRMVATSLQGDTTLLKRYIPELRTATSKAEEMAIVNRKMAEGFSIAEAQTKTFSGKMKQLNNAFGDLKEVAGKEIIDAIKPSLDGITKFAQSEGGIIAVRSAVRGLVTAFIVVGAVLRTVVNIVEILVKSIIGAVRVILRWGEIVSGIFKKVREKIDNVKTAISGAFDKFKDKTGIKKLENNVREGMDKVKEKFAEVTDGAVDKFKEKVKSAGADAVDAVGITAFVDTTKEAFGSMKEKIVADVGDIKDTWTGTSDSLQELWKVEEEKFSEKLDKHSKDLDKFEKNNEKRKKKKKKSDDADDKAEKKRLADLAALKQRFANAGVRSVVDAAASEKATFGSVAAAFVKSQADALSEVLTIKAIAAIASGNIPGAAALTAAAIAVKLAGTKFSQAVGGKTEKFAGGGTITEPVVGIGQRTGNKFIFGEAGDERVTPVNQEGAGGGLTIIVEGDFVVKADDPDEMADQTRARLLGIQSDRR